jgi:iron-sulfur cluster insertion protein
MTDRTLKDKLLKDFHGNEPLIDNTVDSPPTVSPQAQEYFKKFLQETQYVMLSIVGGGCSGFQYSFFIGEMPPEEDHIVICNNPVVVVDNESLFYLKGAEVQFEQSNFSERIIVKNPRAKQSCGCGESFSV